LGFIIWLGKAQQSTPAVDVSESNCPHGKLGRSHETTKAIGHARVEAKSRKSAVPSGVEAYAFFGDAFRMCMAADS
jgi:hypothetical protein